MTVPIDIDERAIKTLRFLSADMVQQAKSGHPGLPMGCATLAFTIWTRHLRHNPRNPRWPGRDRFILSGGHGSALLYSLLYLTGYDLSLEELKHFRQWGSRTPGHPEYGLTPGVEVTTGPLGQGFANGVGMAIAEKHLESEFNYEGFHLFNNFVYAIVTDGDMMEGVTAEAASLAGHLQLGRLIYLYDDNRVSIDGPTDLAFTEDRAARFSAYGWQVLSVDDGNDIKTLDEAIIESKNDPRPSLIICRTTIGYGLPTKQGTNSAHGEPPGEAELIAAKRKADWPSEKSFYIPDDVLSFFRDALTKGHDREAQWKTTLGRYQQSYTEKYYELERRLGGKLPADYETVLPKFSLSNSGMATRVASGQILNAIAAKIPEVMGGSADLTPSTKTWLNGLAAFQAKSPEGRNFHFGVREHAMGAIVNGMSVYGGIIPFGATFLVFSDYMRAPLRISALSGYPSIWIFTHDSIGLGEDGPTHQPIEHLASLRSIPGNLVLRPADANETSMAWKIALARRSGPTCLILTRQEVPILDRSVYANPEGLERGAYILADFCDGLPEVILMASGSEVHIVLDAGLHLASESVPTRVVSFPSWELFLQQSKEYQESVLPSSVRAKIAVEAGVTNGWERWLGSEGVVLGINRFGASAPYSTIYKEFGLTKEAIIKTAHDLMAS